MLVRWVPLLLLACADPADDPATGTANTPDDNTSSPTATTTEVDPAQAQGAQAFTRGIGGALTLLGPQTEAAVSLHEDHGGEGRRAGDGGDDLDEAQRADARNRLEAGLPSCATFDWDLLALTATVTFDLCDLGNGLLVDGVLALSLDLSGATTLALSFADLWVGDVRLDGDAALALSGMDGLPAAALSLDLIVDVDGEVGLVFEHVTLLFSDGLTVDGAGTLSGGGVSGTVTGTAVHWEPTACHPSSGTAAFDLDGLDPITVTFLPTTPADGEVDVVIDTVLGPVEIEGYPLLEPCAAVRTPPV